jgi:aspartate racemase
MSNVHVYPSHIIPAGKGQVGSVFADISNGVGSFPQAFPKAYADIAHFMNTYNFMSTYIGKKDFKVENFNSQNWMEFMAYLNAMDKPSLTPDQNNVVEDTKQFILGSKPVIGIVGGMGKEATLEFQRIISEEEKRRYPVTKEQGENDILAAAKVDNEEKPDRSKHLLRKEGENVESPVPAIIKGFSDLAKIGANLGVMPCNTAHAYIDEIRAGSPIPVLSMIEIALWYIQTNYPSVDEVGLLATDGSVYSKKVYHPSFEAAGIKLVVPDEGNQPNVMDAIYNTKTGVKVGKTRDVPINDIPHGMHPAIRFRNEALHVASKMKGGGSPKIIILGCTEIPLASIQEDMPEDIIILDPMQLISGAIAVACHKGSAFDLGLKQTPEKLRDKNELLKLAIKSFTVDNPIIPSNIEGADGLKQRLAAKYSWNKLPEIGDDFVSSGIVSRAVSCRDARVMSGIVMSGASSPKRKSNDNSPSGRSFVEKIVPEVELSGDESLSSDSEEEKVPLRSGDIQVLLRKHNCTAEAGKDSNNEDVVRIKFDSKGLDNIKNSKKDSKKIYQYIQDKLELKSHSQLRLRTSGSCVITLVSTPLVNQFLKDQLQLDIQQRSQVR